jgi:polysaccharide biosynthesis transport protein
LGSYLAE